MLATCLFMEVNINMYIKEKEMNQPVHLGIAFPHILYCCGSIKYLSCVWLCYGIFLIKENVSIYIYVYLYIYITREICKFNT